MFRHAKQTLKWQNNDLSYVDKHFSDISMFELTGK